MDPGLHRVTKKKQNKTSVSSSRASSSRSFLLPSPPFPPVLSSQARLVSSPPCWSSRERREGFGVLYVRIKREQNPKHPLHERRLGIPSSSFSFLRLDPNLVQHLHRCTGFDFAQLQQTKPNVPKIKPRVSSKVLGRWTALEIWRRKELAGSEIWKGSC